jgi:hypothetical protein
VGLSIERENERNGVLGHGVGRVAWDARDGNAQAFCSFDIDVVESRATERDHPNLVPGEALKVLVPNVVIYKNADRLCSLGREGGGSLQPEIVKA